MPWQPPAAKPGVQSTDPARPRPVARPGQVDELERRLRRLEQPLIPILQEFVKADLPDPASARLGIIYVSDEIGGPTPAFSDGTAWRRVSDLAIVS